MVDTFLVGKEIGEDSHLSDDWTILKNLTFDSDVLLCEAVINDFVELVVQSALIAAQVFLSIAFALSCIVWVADLRNEALAFAPAQGTGDIATFATVVALVAVDDLLCRESHWGALGLLADAVLDHGYGSERIAG